ncbi:hypothetical protein WJX81_007977 [Elliptochloris bilobata]|uniref:Uncharacterized protein n=1 Tax=Elliptochloris bilobata TaxID=381761 RepID=A0AAW1QWL1_9CHLO
MARRRKDSYGVHDVPLEHDNSRGCCGCFAKGFLSVVITLLLLGAAGLSAVSIIAGKQSTWLYYANGADPQYRIQTGWLWFSVNDGAAQSLKDIGLVSWILGIVAVCGLGVSFILALLYLAITLFGKAGKHIGCIAIPGGLLLGCIMAAYYVLAALLMRNYTEGTVNARYTLWPTWGWAIGMGAAGLWFLAGLFACCIPRRPSSYYVKQDDAPPPLPRSGKAAGPTGAMLRPRANDIEMGVRPAVSNGAVAPLPQAMDPDLRANPQNKFRFPSFAKTSRDDAAQPLSQQTVYRSHADEIANKYRK